MSTDTLLIDDDGMPYWNQIEDTNVVYGFNWASRMNAIGHDITALTVQLSSDTDSVQYGPSEFGYGVHAFYVNPITGDSGSKVVFTSKVFLSDGQVDKAKLRIKVIN